MTEKEMYREIMSRYALDPEKIRVNALKQAKKPAWQRYASDYWKPAAGIAAAVALTVSAVGYMNADSPHSGIDITVDSASALSAARRLSEAEQNYFNLQSVENKTISVYTTFCEPMCYNDVLMALSGVADAGEIEVAAVYTDSDVIRGAESIAEYAAGCGGEKNVLAVKLLTASAYYRGIQDLSAVYLAEVGSDEINDETFKPIVVEDNDPLMNDRFAVTAAVTTAPVTTTPFSFDSVTDTDTENVPVIGESADSEADTLTPPAVEEEYEDDPEEENPEEDYDPETGDSFGEESEESEETDAPVTSEPEEETEETTAVEVPTNEIEATTYYGGDVGLLTELYELNIKNSTETALCGDNAVVLTKNGVYFYTLGGITGGQSGISVEMSNPMIVYSDEETMLITGCSASGARNLITAVSFSGNEVHTYDVSANIGASDLGTIYYSKAQGKYFVKTVSETSSFIYEVRISAENGVQFRPLVEAQTPVAAVGCKDNLLYLSAADAVSGTKLYTFNMTSGEMLEVAAFEGAMKIKRGDDFESFALISDGVGYIYDLNRGMAVSTELLNETVRLAASDGLTYFSVDGKTYRISESGTIDEALANGVFGSGVQSEFRVNEITPEKVVVVRDGVMWG